MQDKSGLLEWFEVSQDLASDNPVARRVARDYKELAETLVEQLGTGPEARTALRKLLESKDCAIRQAIRDRRAIVRD